MKGFVLQDCPPPLTLEPGESPGCHPCFWPTGYKLEVPMTFSLDSISLLQWLTELKETFISLLTYKRIHNSRIARWKKHWAGLVEGGSELTCPLRAPSPQISTCSPTQKFSAPYPFGVLWRLHNTGWLIKSLAIGDWTQPLPSQEVRGVKLKVPTLHSPA